MVLDDWIAYLTAQVANGPTIAITAISAAAAAVVTAPSHGLTTGASAAIAGTNSTPVINGVQTVTVIDANTFSVPVTTTIAGTSGTLQAGCGTAMIDLFMGELPDDPITPDLAAVLNEYGGSVVEVRFGLADVYRERPRVQVAVRGNVRDYESGRQRIETIWRVMAQCPMPVTVNSVEYYTIKLLQSPFWLKRDAKWRHTHVFNAELYKDHA